MATHNGIRVRSSTLAPLVHVLVVAALLLPVRYVQCTYTTIDAALRLLHSVPLDGGPPEFLVIPADKSHRPNWRDFNNTWNPGDDIPDYAGHHIDTYRTFTKNCFMATKTSFLSATRSCERLVRNSCGQPRQIDLDHDFLGDKLSLCYGVPQCKVQPRKVADCGGHSARPFYIPTRMKVQFCISVVDHRGPPHPSLPTIAQMLEIPLQGNATLLHPRGPGNRFLHTHVLVVVISSGGEWTDDNCPTGTWRVYHGSATGLFAISSYSDINDWYNADLFVTTTFCAVNTVTYGSETPPTRYAVSKSTWNEICIRTPIPQADICPVLARHRSLIQLLSQFPLERNQSKRDDFFYPLDIPAPPIRNFIGPPIRVSEEECALGPYPPTGTVRNGTDNCHPERAEGENCFSPVSNYFDGIEPKLFGLFHPAIAVIGSIVESVIGIILPLLSDLLSEILPVFFRIVKTAVDAVLRLVTELGLSPISVVYMSILVALLCTYSIYIVPIFMLLSLFITERLNFGDALTAFYIISPLFIFAFPSPIVSKSLLWQPTRQLLSPPSPEDAAVIRAAPRR